MNGVLSLDSVMIDQELQQLGAFKNELIAWLAESGVALLVAILIIAL